jgi:hypothetical protein
MIAEASARVHELAMQNTDTTNADVARYGGDRGKLTSHACGVDGRITINFESMTRQLPTSPP